MLTSLLRTGLISCSLIGFATFAHANPAIYGHQVGIYSVELNKTEVVNLTTPIATVAIGNPSIADVSVHSDRTLFVIGRGFGETNIIAMDARGNIVMNANIQVTNNLPAHGVRIYNGGTTDRRTYSCTPHCLPAPTLGDSPEFVAANTLETETINNPIAPGASAIPAFSPLAPLNPVVNALNTPAGG